MKASDARRWWALGALSLSVLVVGLDLTVLNLALPTLATDLHASTAQLQWIVDAYSLVLAALLLPAGLLGDRFGRKKLLLGGLLVFGAASLACAYASSAGELVAARALLGLGAAAIIPLSLSVLPVLFSEQERQRAITIMLGATFVAFPIGPILGGWLLTHYWWGSVFLINGPVIALALLAVSVLLPESRSLQRPRLDLVGIVVSSLGLAGLTYGAIEAGQHGWGDTAALVAMLAGALLLAAFVVWERRVARRPAGQPLVDLTLFRSASFTWGTLLATVVTFAMFGLLFAVPQYFQAVRGTDALGTGLRLLPLIGGLLVGAQTADRLAPRIGAKATVALGFTLLAAGLGAGATTGLHTSDGFTLTWIAVLGAGLGFVLPTAIDAALSALSTERSGAGSALILAVRQVGATIGVAVLGSVLNAGYHARLDVTGLPPQLAEVVRDSAAAGVAVAQQLGSALLLDSVRAAFVHGMDTLLWTCGGLAVAGIVLTLVFLPRRAATLAAPETEPAASEADVVV
ncbi:MAG TPA: MFS transporter [Actinomycetes bacterium]|jgi:EmrB/QacA subfamily drug resistance transporter|nr:MFS transporter [Actinomycetes bacterium]